MSCAELTAKYAPTLLHLAEQLDAFDPVIAGWAAGPVPEAPSPGGPEPHILIQLWEQYGQESIVSSGSDDTYTLMQADVGGKIKIILSFDDATGAGESIASDWTAIVSSGVTALTLTNVVVTSLIDEFRHPGLSG